MKLVGNNVAVILFITYRIVNHSIPNTQAPSVLISNSAGWHKIAESRISFILKKRKLLLWDLICFLVTKSVLISVRTDFFFSPRI